jgi:mono/diheme cytochrome c family protein
VSNPYVASSGLPMPATASNRETRISEIFRFANCMKPRAARPRFFSIDYLALSLALLAASLPSPIVRAQGVVGVPSPSTSGAATVAKASPDAPPQVARGAYLVNAGDCIACHTAKGGKPLAGGLYMKTPFGSISTPNITPDKATGIGAWTDEQFYRAMHDGLGHKGEYLYPVMPFPWYTIVSREDSAPSEPGSPRNLR